jgi:hypothetical protein
VIPSQGSLLNQLHAVRDLANRHGYYDAADYIGILLSTNTRTTSNPNTNQPERETLDHD